MAHPLLKRSSWCYITAKQLVQNDGGWIEALSYPSCLFQMLHVVILSTFCTCLIVVWCVIPFSHTPDTGAAALSILIHAPVDEVTYI